MPLDPDFEKLLEQISDLQNLDLEEIDAVQFRNLMDSADVSMHSEDIPIRKVDDLMIPVDGVSLRSRLYSHEESSNSLIIYFHGGGFVFGNIDTHDSVCRLIARDSGCKVLSIEYRLAPEHKFPTAVKDAFSAYEWVLQNTEMLGVDRERIGIAGDSAGGNICAVLSIMLRDGNKKSPRLQLLFYPVVTADITFPSQRELSEGYFLTGTLSAWFMRQYMKTPADLSSPYFSVLDADRLSGLPETIIFTAEFDPLRDQGEAFIARLKASGTSATGIRALGMIHGFVSFFEFSRSARNYLLMASHIMGDALRK